MCCRALCYRRLKYFSSCSFIFFLSRNFSHFASRTFDSPRCSRGSTQDAASSLWHWSPTAPGEYYISARNKYHGKVFRTPLHLHEVAINSCTFIYLGNWQIQRPLRHCCIKKLGRMCGWNGLGKIWCLFEIFMLKNENMMFLTFSWTISSKNLMKL